MSAFIPETALVALCGVDGTLEGDRLADDAILYVSRSTGRFTPVRITVATISAVLKAEVGHTLDCLRWQYQNGETSDRECVCTPTTGAAHE